MHTREDFPIIFSPAAAGANASRNSALRKSENIALVVNTRKAKFGKDAGVWQRNSC